MRDPARIEPMLTLVRTIWTAQPDLRLGQLLLNVVEDEGTVAYYLEDDLLEARLRQVYGPLLQECP